MGARIESVSPVTSLLAPVTNLITNSLASHMTLHPNASQNEQREPIGLGRDLHRLKKHGGMTLTEMREFIRQLHGRKPSEVLGIVSNNALIRAMGESVLYSGLLLVVLTVVPFLFAGDEKGSGSKAVPLAQANNEATSPAATADNPVPGSDATAISADSPISTDDAQKAVKAMGLGETKTADPDTNPLDNLDSLLDDAK